MSWQLKALNAFLRLAARPLLGHVHKPAPMRRALERLARLLLPVPPLVCHLVGQDGLHRISRGTRRTRRIILYFHGGGYVAGSPETHLGMIGRLSGLAGVEVAAPNYPLAPEFHFPAAFEDACQAWARLSELGYRPTDIVLGGDSAGGGLALALLGHLCRVGTPPAAAFALSPWCDLSLSGNSLHRNAGSDVLFPARRIGELVDLILGDETDRCDPRLSPLFADFPNCPQVLLHFSETEILQDDSCRMAQVLRQAGAQVVTHTHPNAPHVWHLFDGWIPEAREALRDVARFIKVHL